MEKKEKRIYPRINCFKPVKIKCIDSDGQIAKVLTAVILDISKGGVNIESPVEVENKFIIISTVDMNHKTYGIRGKIVWSDKNDSDGFLLGIKFDAPESSCIKFIGAVIRTHFIELHQKPKEIAYSSTRSGHSLG